MPDLAEAPKLRLVSRAETAPQDTALASHELAELANRSAVFAHDLSEEVLGGNTPTESEEEAIKDLADKSLMSVNSLLIVNPNLLNYEIASTEAEGQILVRDVLNDTLADLDPDVEKARPLRNVAEITSPVGLSLAVDRAVKIIKDDDGIYERDKESKADYYRLLGRISSGSLDALAAISAGTEQNSPELNDKLQKAANTFREVESQQGSAPEDSLPVAA